MISTKGKTKLKRSRRGGPKEGQWAASHEPRPRDRAGVPQPTVDTSSLCRRCALYVSIKTAYSYISAVTLRRNVRASVAPSVKYVASNPAGGTDAGWEMFAFSQAFCCFRLGLARLTLLEQDLGAVGMFKTPKVVLPSTGPQILADPCFQSLRY